MVQGSSRVWRNSDLRHVRLHFGAVIAVLIVAGSVLGRFRVNSTRSLPIGLYWTMAPRPLTRGSIVLVCLPVPIARFARGRGYLWRGRCSGSVAPIGKLVLATEGDVVGVGPAGLSVNGALVPRSEPQPTDSEGRPINHYPYGTYRVATNELWLYSPYHPMSFDSRYFGPVPMNSVESRMVAVWAR